MSESPIVSDWITYIGGSLSLACTLGIMISYCCVRELKKMPAFLLVFHISFADFVFVMVSVINEYLYQNYSIGNNSKYCTVLGFFQEYTKVVVFFWAYAFAYTMHKFYTGQYHSTKGVRSNILKTVLICWGVPLIFASIPIIIPKIVGGPSGYGPASLNCWINSGLSGDSRVIITLLGSYVPLGIISLSLIYYYCKVIAFVRNSASDTVVKQTISDLILYPAGPLLNYFAEIADRVFNLGLGLDISYITYFHILTNMTIGIINAFAYGGSSRVRKAIASYFRKKDRTESFSTGLQISLRSSSVI